MYAHVMVLCKKKKKKSKSQNSFTKAKTIYQKLEEHK